MGLLQISSRLTPNTSPPAARNYNKLAGHTFTHLPPADSITRTRRANGNMYIVSGDDDTIVTSGVNITLADDDRTYDAGTKFQVGGQVLFNVSPDAAYDFRLARITCSRRA